MMVAVFFPPQLTPMIVLVIIIRVIISLAMAGVGIFLEVMPAMPLSTMVACSASRSWIRVVVTRATYHNSVIDNHEDRGTRRAVS
jgi:uncharacterized membrane protein YbaN (DUF454 family)